MAEAVVEIVINNLSSLIQNEMVGPLLSFNEDLETLKSRLTSIKATLQDAEEKHFTQSSIKDWLQKLKHAAHMLDDILDECATHALELHDGGINCGGSPGKLQCSCLSSFNPKHVMFRYKTAKKIKMISQRLDQIAKERHDFHLKEIVMDTRTGVMDWHQTTSLITQPQVYGREKERDNIIDFLVGDASNSQDLSVYPILGIGGIGKTTLAQLIFNHEKVAQHFDLRIWVCVSEDFSLNRMTKAIIQSASGHACEDMELEPLQRRLRQIIEKKRYLLVLDDVWNDNQDNWQRLRSILGCGAQGASILVTTCLLKVATVLGTMPPHELSELSSNDCWELFKLRAFEPGEKEREELVIIGKEIVKKCAGVPLAAIALGSLLRFKREEREWLSIKDNNLWSLQDENSVMPALRLSYLNLPARLRQCFAFCAIFPKDQEIDKQFLMDLWMANGFISSSETLEAEDVCDQVWNELYWRSFFQDINRDEFGKIKSFKMHDLIHDLAQSISQEICCITYDNGRTSVPRGTRHLSINLFQKENEIGLSKVRSLKSYLGPSYFGNRSLPVDVLNRYSLRVLQYTSLTHLPATIGDLKYLRYLNISHGRFKTLPESICKLRNLQVLKLEYCCSLEILPTCLKQLKALQHLYLMGCLKLLSMPPSIGELTSLTTLSMFVVGKETRSDLTEMGTLKLKGELHIKYLERVTSVADAEKANMGEKQLHQLLLTWNKFEESRLQAKDIERVLEVLQPSMHGLQSLQVGGYPGVQFPQWMGSPSLKHLREVVIVDCINSSSLPALRKLPALKRLEISNINHLTDLNNETYENTGGFMALERLILNKLPNLIRLSREGGENMFPLLSELHIYECPELSLPSLPSLKELIVEGKCHQGLLNSIYKLHSLESLAFNGCDKESPCFLNGMQEGLTSLKILWVSNLSRLEILTCGIIKLSTIQELYLVYIKNLEILPDQVLEGMQSLKVFKIIHNQKFKLSAGFQHLTCLKELHIVDCPEVEGFPEDLQHMTALQSLNLINLQNLKSLPDWLGNLVLLHSLRIGNCPKLRYLPTSIKSLDNLKFLSIEGCPELSKRCERETGKDWPLIAHVPKIHHSPDCHYEYQSLPYSWIN
ncbi:hypothetical protein PIB30_015794 [Stylosanthes scabra]|uniref:Uncharacterized protein n=1 Tax=Stylosanthes scabra TaxID=79078 RepID=A0ABU6Z3N3_9FABA|nr:hypothetical protein [Stylosanthes scabra]